MPPSYRDYQEYNYPERYITDEDREKRIKHDKEMQEQILRKAWTENTYPLTIESYLYQLEKRHETRIESYNQRNMFLVKKEKEQLAEIYNLKEQIDWINKSIFKNERIHKRQKQTLARRIKKILNDYELVENDEE